MRALLDTHAFLWWLIGSRKLSARAADVIADRRNRIVVSAVTGFEITTKVRLGRMPIPPNVVAELELHIRTAGFQLLPIEMSHALFGGRLEFPHGDPFDRILMSQAILERMPLITNDGIIKRSGIDTIW